MSSTGGTPPNRSSIRRAAFLSGTFRADVPQPPTPTAGDAETDCSFAAGDTFLNGTPIEAVVSRADARRRRCRATSGLVMVGAVIVLAVGGWWSLGHIFDDRQIVDTIDIPDDLERSTVDPSSGRLSDKTTAN